MHMQTAYCILIPLHMQAITVPLTTWLSPFPPPMEIAMGRPQRQNRIL